MVVTEALARGLPVVATDVGGVAKTLGHGTDGARPGLLVPPDDPAALAAALRTWLGDAEVRVAWRRAARERRASLSGWSATTAVLADVLEKRRDDRRAEPGQRRMARPPGACRRRGARARARRASPAAPPGDGCRVIHDLACGTGSMGRWLAPLLPGPQSWVLHDLDADLLQVAAAELPARPPTVLPSSSRRGDPTSPDCAPTSSPARPSSPLRRYSTC